MSALLVVPALLVPALLVSAFTNFPNPNPL